MNSSEVVTTLIIECHVYTSLSSLVNGILDRIECFFFNVPYIETINMIN